MAGITWFNYRYYQKKSLIEIPRHGGFFASSGLAIFDCLKHYWFIKRILRSAPHDGRKNSYMFYRRLFKATFNK